MKEHGETFATDLREAPTMTTPFSTRFRPLRSRRRRLSVLILCLLGTGALPGTLLVGGGTAAAAVPARRAPGPTVDARITGARTGGAGRVWYVSAGATTVPACGSASATDAFPTIADALSCARNGDTVEIGAGTFAGEFTVSANVTLKGHGARTVIADPFAGGAQVEVTIASNVSAKLANLTVDGGATSTNGMVGNAGISDAGASLTLDHVTVTGTDNNDPNPQDTTAAAAVTVDPAGSTTLTVVDSTVSDNLGVLAGGIEVNGTSAAAPSTVRLLNSTISGNHAIDASGGILVHNTVATVRDDTISGNSGGISGGLEIGSSSTATVTDTILAANTASLNAATDDCYLASNGEITSGGHNLVGVADPGGSSDCRFANGVNGDLTGTPSSPLDPGLSPLADNGGPTQTQALLPGSPAIAAGNPTDCEAAPINGRDQRGHPRHATARLACDIGAYDTGGASV